jgi:hypothetical protein
MCVDDLENDPRIPESIRSLLQEYLSLVDLQLAGLMRAFYIEGSIALGGFSERFSDVDFVAMLNRQATQTEIDTLCHIHDVVRKHHPRWEMMGSYLQADDLERADDRIEPCPVYHDGVLGLDGHFELHSIEGWILKHHGIAIAGPEPQDLPFVADWDLIIAKMKVNLNTYWVRWARRPDKIAITLSDWGVQWTVLGVLRQFYSFRENAITTKRKAGEYALTCMPAVWHRLIQEAINIRQGGEKTLYRSRVARTIQTVSLLRYVIQSCNTGFCTEQVQDLRGLPSITS